MSSQDGVVGPRRNLREAWSAELMLTVPETWDVLLVLHSDLTVGVERCNWPSTRNPSCDLPSGLVGLTLGFSPLPDPGMT